MKPEIFYVSNIKVGCSGGEKFGHPLVYLDLSQEGKVVCPYCSAVFIHREIDEDE